MRNLFQYFGNLRAGKIALWCYLIWYAAMTSMYFDPRLSLWINSLGISIIIGAALILSVIPTGGIRVMEKWVIARLFMMPFCVSSYAALIKDQGFIVIFSSKLAENAAAAMACAIFVAVAYTCKVALKPREQ